MPSKNVPPLYGRRLPRFINDLLASPPARGEGLHNWLFRVARLLHPYHTAEEIHVFLGGATLGFGVRPGEIEDTIENSRCYAWNPGQNPPAPAQPARPGTPPPSVSFQRGYPTPDAAEIALAVQRGPSVAELVARSPGTLDTATSEILRALFSLPNADPLVCVGTRSSIFGTFPLSRVCRHPHLDRLALIVPSIMTARTGQTQAGRESQHTLENTGPRRFIVVEFDSGTPDEHAARLWHLSQFAPLVLVVHSGVRSLHGWFPVGDATDAETTRFMRYAARIGADPALFRNRAQFVRLPGGTRDNGNRQSVLYWDPSVLVANNPGHAAEGEGCL